VNYGRKRLKPRYISRYQKLLPCCGPCGREAGECGQAVDNMDVVHPCPHVPQGEGRSEGLVHKSTGFFPDNQLINCTTALIHTQKTEFYPQILPKSQLLKENIDD